MPDVTKRMIDLTLSTGEPVQLKPAPVRRFKGTRLPGAGLHRAEKRNYAVTFQEFTQPLFRISHFLITVVSAITVQVREREKGLQFLTVLAGELLVRNRQGQVFTILAGQYLIDDRLVLIGELKPGKDCSYFSIYYSGEFLETIGVEANPVQETPKFMADTMKEIIDEMLENPYDQRLRIFYYENSIRELLFLHLAIPTHLYPGELSAIDIAAVYYADRIIADNLNSHFTIRDLAKKAGTNAFVLKKGFQQMFGIGVFGRLLQRRMDKAKLLLETTNKPIKEICQLAGYETLAGFITSFRKRFKITPKDWRKQKRNGG